MDAETSSSAAVATVVFAGRVMRPTSAASGSRSDPTAGHAYPPRAQVSTPIADRSRTAAGTSCSAGSARLVPRAASAARPTSARWAVRRQGALPSRARRRTSSAGWRETAAERRSTAARAFPRTRAEEAAKRGFVVLPFARPARAPRRALPAAPRATGAEECSSAATHVPHGRPAVELEIQGNAAARECVPRSRRARETRRRRLRES